MIWDSSHLLTDRCLSKSVMFRSSVEPATSSISGNTLAMEGRYMSQSMSGNIY